MERCPQCRARLKGRTICARCEADLSLVLAIEAKAASISRQAMDSLSIGDIEAAYRQAGAVHYLHATDFHRALFGFTENLLNRH